LSKKLPQVLETEKENSIVINRGIIMSNQKNCTTLPQQYRRAVTTDHHTYATTHEMLSCDGIRRGYYSP